MTTSLNSAQDTLDFLGQCGHLRGRSHRGSLLDTCVVMFCICLASAAGSNATAPAAHAIEAIFNDLQSPLRIYFRAVRAACAPGAEELFHLLLDRQVHIPVCLQEETVYEAGKESRVRVADVFDDHVREIQCRQLHVRGNLAKTESVSDHWPRRQGEQCGLPSREREREVKLI